ncbi:MAG: hypothetical protein OJF49_001549 [Ktedonobacterales bacterium]|nr:MAG: hypothetical protein OJF49_001549 [Ktedonobacterales bacterium]
MPLWGSQRAECVPGALAGGVASVMPLIYSALVRYRFRTLRVE